MKPSQVESALERASRAVNFARDTRSYHRRRTKHGSKQRATDIAVAQEKLRQAMKPLRSYLGEVMYLPQTAKQEALTERVREASQSLQSERRKLWKLANPTRKDPA